MNRRASPIYLILLSAALVSSTLIACAATPSQEFSARYRITLIGPGQQGLRVQARFAGLTPGPLELAMLRAWAGYAGLDAQLVWIRLGTTRGPALEVPLAQSSSPGLEQDVARWGVQVPGNGVIQLEYYLELAGQDGEVPSRVEDRRALLLTRSLFVFPLPWLDQLQAPFQGAVQVQVVPPAGWAVHTTWPSNAEGTAFLPDNAEDLVDTAVVLGDYTLYELRDEAFRARVLLPAVGDEKLARERADALAQGMFFAHRLFGAAPNLGPEASLMAVFVPAPDQAPADQPVGMALGDDLILVQAAMSSALSLDEALMREAVRLWMVNAVRTAPRWSMDPCGREPWLTYGWTEYLAWRIRLDSGRISPLQYWEHLRRVARALAESPFLNKFSLADVAGQMRGDAELARFVYSKSQLGALLADRRLRAETEGRVDLSEVARQLHRRYGYYITGSLVGGEQVVNLLGELSGANYADFYASLVYGVGPLDLSAVPELSGPPVGETRTFSTPDGLRLFYQWLDGPSRRAAIYLSGGPGRPPYDLMYLMAQPLQQYLDVAYLEQRGSGRSVAPGQGAYSLDAYINDIELLRQEIGAARVTLIGHAWGGFCALHYAARYPERVAALILLSPIPSFSRFAQAALQGLMAQFGGGEGEVALQVRELATQGIHAYGDLATLSHLLEQARAYGSDPAAGQEVLRKAYAYYVKIYLLPEGLSLNNEGILPVLVARDGLLRADALTDLNLRGCPILVLHGEKDKAISSGLLQDLCSRLGAELKEIPGAGHYLYVDSPDVVLGEILSFLEANPD